MSELSQALGGSAPKHTIKANGKVYSVGLVTQEVKVAYEKALYARAREGVREMKTDLDKDDYAEMFQTLADRYEAGEFALEGERGRKALNSPRGSLLLLSILMNVDEMEVIRIVSENEEEVNSVFKAVIKESFPGSRFEEPEAPKAPPAG